MVKDNKTKFTEYFDNLLVQLKITKELSYEQRMSYIKEYISKLKKSKEAVSQFKNRDVRTFDTVKFFDNEIKEVLSNKESSSLVWTYIQMVVLLYEIENKGSNKLIKKLYKKIKKNNKEELNDQLISQCKNPGGLFNMDSIKKMLPNNGEVDDNSKNMIDTLISDIKDKLNSKDRLDVKDLFKMSSELSSTYRDKYNNGQLNMNGLLNGVVELIQNPSKLEGFKNMDKKIDINPTEVLNELKSSIPSGQVNPFDMLDKMGGIDGIKDMITNIMPQSNPLEVKQQTLPDNISVSEKEKQVNEYYDNLKV